MHDARARLELCRAALCAIREQEQDVRALEEIQPRSPEEKQALAEQLTRSRMLLQQARRQYPMRLSLAMQALEGLTGMEYKVLWLYYVLAYSNAAIGERLHYDCREVFRRKRAALNRLDQTSEGVEKL